MSIDVSQFQQVFFEESFEGLDVMESNLLNLAEGGTGEEESAEVVNTIFRAAHSIKGGAGTFGFTAVSEFTHLVETLLEQLRAGEREVSRELIDLLLETVDALRAMLTAVQDGAEVDAERIASLSARLQEALDRSPAASAGVAEGAQSAPATDTAAGQAGWHIRFTPHAHMMQTGNDPVRILRELDQLGLLESEVDISRLPELAELDPETSYLGWDLRLSGNIPREQIDEIFEWVEDDCDLEIEPLTAAAPEPEPMAGTDAGEAEGPAAEAEAVSASAAEPTAPAPASRQVAEPGRQKARGESGSIRVSIDKVDALINLVGELVITQSMLGQLGSDLGEGQDDHSGAIIEKLRDGLGELERNTRELQESVMRIRMLPISFAFSRFPRMVHDLSGKLGKEVELVLSGESTELDKTVLEKIGDPLVHLVRNALDHGLEEPEARRAAGKPETGQVHLNAYHQGGNIVIEVADDGRGMDPGRILAKARERGLVGESEQVPEERVLDLIFHPGFSTAEQISDVSGRGVGMDVVRRNIKDLSGSIEVNSELGKGSTFVIRLPLTLAIVDGQLVQVAGEVFIAPLVSIVESLQIRSAQIKRVAGETELYRLRDEYIPIVRLAEAFGFAGGGRGSLDDRLLVVVEGEGEKIGLVVDDLLGQQQVVIKSLETNFKPVPGVSGATILGDGTVALILDVSGLVRLRRDAERGGSAEAAA